MAKMGMKKLTRDFSFCGLKVKPDGRNSDSAGKMPSSKNLLLKEFNMLSEEPKEASAQAQEPNMHTTSKFVGITRKKLFEDSDGSDKPENDSGRPPLNRNLSEWFDACSDKEGLKKRKIAETELEGATDPSLKQIPDPGNKCTSPTFFSRWRKGDNVFSGLFSSGVTPKIPRPVCSIKTPKPQILFDSEPEEKEEEVDSQYGINPFISITPQIKYKKRSISFHHPDNSEENELCLSPKPNARPKVMDTPMPVKKTLKLPNFDENDSEEEQDKIAQQFMQQYNTRGSRFDQDFEEISTVGRGHFGSVVRCKNKLDGIEYAIKITDKNTPKNRTSMVEAIQEVYALSALSVSSENPYIVRYYRGWVENGQLYIQMELCDSNLAEIFEAQEYDEGEVFKLLRHVCLGLNELHEKGIVHLDLKMENIMMSASGKYKLGDLGLSRLMNKLSHNIPEGDCRYIAQELFNDDQNAPVPDLRKADVFSLGILAYELVERRRVLTSGQEWHDLREGRVRFSHPDSISSEIKRMITHMLSPRPEDRPTTAYLLQTYLLSEQEKELKMCKNMLKAIFSNRKRLAKTLGKIFTDEQE